MYGTDIVLNAPTRGNIAVGGTVTVTHKPEDARYDLQSEIIVDAAWPLRDGGFYFGGMLPSEPAGERFGTPMPLAEYLERHGERRLQVVIYPEGSSRKSSCCVVTERLPISA